MKKIISCVVYNALLAFSKKIISLGHYVLSCLILLITHFFG